MQNSLWCSQCPWQDSCKGADEYYRNVYDDTYRFEEDFEEQENLEGDFAEDFDAELDQEIDGFDRAPRDVDRVIGLINRRMAAQINEIVRTGLDRKLVDYFIRTMVEYLDRNFNRYTGPIQRRIQEASRDIRRDLPWIFGIMNLYGVSPATQARFLNDVVEISLRNLRQPITPPRPPRPPRPREE